MVALMPTHPPAIAHLPANRRRARDVTASSVLFRYWHAPQHVTWAILTGAGEPFSGSNPGCRRNVAALETFPTLVRDKSRVNKLKVAVGRASNAPACSVHTSQAVPFTTLPTLYTHPATSFCYVAVRFHSRYSLHSMSLFLNFSHIRLAHVQTSQIGTPDP